MTPKKQSKILFSALFTLVCLFGASQAHATSYFDADVQLLRDQSTKKIYAVIDGIRHYIPNFDVLQSYAYRFIHIKDVSSSTLQAFTPLRLIKSSLGPRVYLLDQLSGQKVWFPTEKSFLDSGEQWKDIVHISGDDSRTLRNGRLVKIADDPNIYYLDYTAQTRALIPSPDLFTAAGFRWSDVLTVPQPLLDGYQQIDPLSLDTLPAPPEPPTAPPSAALSVSLAVTSLPVAVPSGTTRNEVAKIVLHGGDSTASVEAITITRRGFLQDRDVTSLLVFDESGFALTRPQQFVNGAVHFTFLKPVSVAANQTQSLTLTANFATTLATGSQSTVTFSLENAADIESTGGTITGSFPLLSRTYTVLNSTALIGSLQVSVVQLSSGARDIRVGEINQDLNRFKFTVQTGRESVSVERLVLTMVGNGSIDDFAHLKLVDSSSRSVAVAGSTSGNTVALRFTSPYSISAGQSQEFILRGDIISGNDRQAQFIIENDYDIYAVGNSFGYAVSAVSAGIGGSFPVGSTLLTGVNALHIIGGSVVVALSTNSPSGPLTKGASDTVLASIDIRPSGQNLRWDRLTIEVATTAPHTKFLGSLSLRLKGGDRIATVDADTVTDHSVTTYLSTAPILVNGKTYTYELVGSLSDAVQASDSYQVNFSNFHFTVSGETNTVTFATVVAGPVRATQEISLFVRNDPRFTAASIPAGKVRAKIGRLLLKASPGEDIKIDEVVLEPIGSSPVIYSHGFSNLKLGNVTIVSPSGGSYRFPLSVTIPANREYGYDLLVDSSFASDGSVAQFTIGGITAHGKTSGALISVTYGNEQTTAVVVERSVLTVSPDTTFTGGTATTGRNVPVAGFTVTASGAEDIQLSGLTFIDAPGSSGLSVTRGYASMRLVDATTGYTRGSTISSPVSGSGGNRVTGPTLAPGQVMRLRVYVNTTDGVTGDTIALQLLSVETIGRDSRIAAEVAGVPLATGSVTF
ncbi:hypothetical protein COV04_03705 [Candidatus Uhrbacteria bacterium CG10_big_fil_rev_8_21_14_0_10_48_11]|uniref:Uncharacterized protein n=1 Tax=Candidatus Uhrbacteria bacterium CG10_big_fil_rev_8_21_14_0_10_48_11 TaxID=1975037 RepID=A0A2M8LE16_9BACT|nr:MAG: hypothetical protein COV04_03705 [Candidatus Uhrbacteria bacterium CG10_big_fil_rev_8_21_14_0_10_48_11]